MNIVTERKVPIDFRIGSDAEFVFLKSNHAISLVDIYGVDREDLLKAALGPDGHAPISEVRPTPTIEPLEVVSNINNIFKSEIATNPELLTYKWKSGSFVAGKFLGGHVHFGIHSKFIQPQTAATIFSNYVASISLLLEDKNDGLKRRTTPNWEGKLYGFKDEIRIKSISHWEHRTMSSWLSSPYIAAAILCLSKTVMFEILNNPSFKPDIDFHPNVFTGMMTDNIRKMFPHIWSQIIKMKLYSKYKRYINVIKFLVDNERNWFPQCSMKEAWGLEKIKPIGKIEPIKVKNLWERLDNLGTRINKLEKNSKFVNYEDALGKWKVEHDYHHLNEQFDGEWGAND